MTKTDATPTLTLVPAYQELLEALRERYQLPPFPEPLPSTQFHLELEGGIVITIDWHGSAEEGIGEELVEFFSEIGEYQPEQELKILQQIAEANFFWGATGGATLSAQLPKRKVYLAYQRPLELLQPKKFIALVEQFGGVAETWQTIIGMLQEEEPPAQ